MNTIEVLVPVPASRVANHPLAPRHTGLAGLRIGWLDNMKANAAALLDAVATTLTARGLRFEAVRLSKNATAAAPAGVMAHLLACDAVVLAIAD